MARIAFAAPGIDAFHLHERLRRELEQHGHATTVLCTDRAAHTFYRRQGGDVVLVRAGATDPMHAPIGDLATRECTRRGITAHHPRFRAVHGRLSTQLARLLPTMLRHFETLRPDLVLLHGERSAARGLLQFVARELGTRVLWTGAGLLPHTLQIDERGLDGDAAAIRRPLAEYRVVNGEPSLLEACLVNMLARTTPSALSRRDVVTPPLLQRCRDALACLVTGDLAGPAHALFGWQRALPPAGLAETVPARLPTTPFVTLLLQSPDDERVRLDCDAPPTTRELIDAAAAAVSLVDPQLALLVVVPERGIDHREVDGLQTPVPVYFAASRAAAEAAALGLAVITVNHPLACAALLAGAPVVHTGRALYGLRGVATEAVTGSLGPALANAIEKRHPSLQKRYLTWLFGHGHLWCSPTHPDHNGLLGLVQAIEARLDARSPTGQRLHYRAGPAWPLAAEGRGH